MVTTMGIMSPQLPSRILKEARVTPVEVLGTIIPEF